MPDNAAELRDFLEHGSFADKTRMQTVSDAIEKMERMEKALEDILAWSRAYPLRSFPEPDLKKAAEVLKANGMTLDAISADAMRHVLDGIANIVRDGLGIKKAPG